jgi:cell wall-associated NlpC family hydrolase
VVSEAGESIVALARGQLGGAYVWGGEQPGAFDCSGLVRWAVRQATGERLPRVAADQARAGRPIARAALQPGDLVFFQNTYGPGITHVGIYAGAGRFIHAADESRGIITTRLDDPYWSARYAGARRVAGS